MHACAHQARSGCAVIRSRTGRAPATKLVRGEREAAKNWDHAGLMRAGLVCLRLTIPLGRFEQASFQAVVANLL